MFDRKVHLSGLKFLYVPNVGLCYTNQRGKMSESVNSFPEDEYLLPQINDFLSSLFSQTTVPQNGVKIYTRLSMDASEEEESISQLYRADPLWTSTHVGGGDKHGVSLGKGEPSKHDPWHDFAYVSWQSNESGRTNDVFIPARLICFLEIPEGTMGVDRHANQCPPGNYAILQSCVEQLNACPPKSLSGICYYQEK